ncbi:hypothetical protein [Halorarum salinum]|uniref:Uncharacterized protein n=1 Tax=Halorarum salinum TaxID=2743089 RepID=A0A7D5QJ89_9EURY|nr:hypothetical protein [Halobaculum salinum]QLG63564.1 hypothetical protein HUG12_18260 [Halobaculum salinum]
MYRRGFLSGTVAVSVLGAASGCLDGGTGGGVDDPDDGDGTDAPADGGNSTPSDDDSTPAETGTDGSTLTIADREFVPTGDCGSDDAGTARVEFDGNEATVTGCITGRNGCQRATLGDVEYDAETDAVTVVVTTTAGEETPDACTQQLVHRAYEVTLSFRERLPSELVVFHESMDERTEAGRATSD